MCTAISENKNGHLFGRTLDVECSYGERAVITPRNYKIELRHEKALGTGYAIIGIAHVSKEYPLYYDAINEKGLGVAALNFPFFSKYYPKTDGKTNIASFELPLFILRKCSSVDEATDLLKKTNITDDCFDRLLSVTPLHWLIADKKHAITLESVDQGLKIYRNELGVLTNSPEFSYHLANLANYMHLSNAQPKNTLCNECLIVPYSRGMGSIGLPGDFSSASRFVRGVFVKNHTLSSDGNMGEISRFFHIMEAVSQPLGCALTDNSAPISTRYTSCADIDNSIYYFTTYGCRRIQGIKMSDFDLNTDKLLEFSMDDNEDVSFLNKRKTES